jgi:tetratricopeptide (TPR) repeat protein
MRLFILSILFWGQTILADENSELIKLAYYQSYHYERTENYNAAISAMLPVLEAYPKGYIVNLRLGWLYYLSNHYANSMQRYVTAIKTAPDSIEARLGLILPQLAQERYSQAEQTAYQIINKDYANYYANLRLIIILRKQRKSDLALDIAKKCWLIIQVTAFLLSNWG